MKKKEAVTVIKWELKCDNPTCDWKDDTIDVEDYEKWINGPCPKCGENLLTKKDFDNAMIVLKSLKAVSAICGLLGIKRKKGEKMVEAEIETHNEITIKLKPETK